MAVNTFHNTSCGVNTITWTSSKILAVLLGGFVGVWAAHLAGANPWISLAAGAAFALLIFLAIRKR